MNDEDLIREFFEALPRLKQYRLSESQRAFIERMEKMQNEIEMQMEVIH